MKVINKTEWQTRDLKRILVATLNRNSRVEGQLTSWEKKNLQVEIVYGRRNYYSGNAYYNGSYMRLRIPRTKLKVTQRKPTVKVERITAPVAKSTLVELFIHELEHIRGYHHKSMSKWRTRRYDWVEDDRLYPMREKSPEKPKPKADVQLRRYANVLRKVVEKERALSRLQKLLKKWRQKQRYYEKTLVAAGKLPEKKK